VGCFSERASLPRWQNQNRPGRRTKNLKRNRPTKLAAAESGV